MELKVVRSEVDGDGVALVTLSRPDRLNTYQPRATRSTGGCSHRPSATRRFGRTVRVFPPNWRPCADLAQQDNGMVATRPGNGERIVRSQRSGR